MRRLMLGWIVLALLLLALGGLHASETLQVTGEVTATTQEADEGYFAVGQETMLIVKPGSGLHAWLLAHTGQRVSVSVAKEDVR